MTEQVKIDFTLPQEYKQGGAQIRKKSFNQKKMYTRSFDKYMQNKIKNKLTNHGCYTKRARAAS